MFMMMMMMHFLGIFSKNTQTQNFVKNRPIRVELLRADTDGRTDMTKLVVDLRDFTNVPKEKAL